MTETMHVSGHKTAPRGERIASTGPDHLGEWLEMNDTKVNAAEQIQVWADLSAAATEGPWRDSWGASWEARVVTHDGSIADVSSSKDACFMAASRTTVPKMAAALQAVLAVHKRERLLGEPGDPECPHDDYEHERHFYGEDDMLLCEDTAGDESICAGCPEDTWGERESWPCPTVRAINEALGVES